MATVGDLLRGRSRPITATQDEWIKDVLARMIKHDYSQLPVVDSQEKPIALITSDSIVRTLHVFGVKTDGIRVADAMLKLPPIFLADDDLFDLLDKLADSEVAL